MATQDAAKKPWQSKTVVVNAILAALGVISAFIPSLSFIGDFIKNHAELIATIWGVLNIALRFITKDRISLGE